MARLGFCGACPTETETSRREAGFPRVFVNHATELLFSFLEMNDLELVFLEILSKFSFK